MYRFSIKVSPIQDRFAGARLMGIWALLFCCTFALAQDAAPVVSTNTPLNVRATHLLGLENTKNNSSGTLSIQDNALVFRQSSGPSAKIDIASVRDVFVGGESKQVGGLPMKLGKAAAPYGAGRAVSLFAHKKYDTLTLEYADASGGIHGTVFQLNKGDGEPVRKELFARGVSAADFEGQPKNDTVEVTHAKE